MRCRSSLPDGTLFATTALALAALIGADAAAQTSGGAQCASRSPAAAEAVKRRTSVALYYELKLARLGGRVYEWRANDAPRLVMNDAAHVAVDAGHGYAIDAANRVLRWDAGSGKTEPMLGDAAFLAAGDTGMLAIRCDGSLWQRKADARNWQRIADAAIHAWVGDSSDYYVDPQGRLYATGEAHRGQYGNGRLDDAGGWVAVAEDVSAVYAHTGHAVHLRRDGTVLGTGGNRFGPLGAHGYGDKAARWGVIFEGAVQLATGSRHTMAIRPDGSLWSWGSTDGLQPKRVLADAVAVAGGEHETLAITSNGSLWSWRVGGSPKKVQLPAQ
ncbi:MAG: hypothetical protein ABIQ33_09235 [Caldimonas sp.]